jgi:hypothetical protein
MKALGFFDQLDAEVCKFTGVMKVFSAAYHSRGHGMVERHNRTIEDRLKHTTNQACNNWDVWLPEALLAIRSTPASGTKMSPFASFTDAIRYYQLITLFCTHNHPHLWPKLRHIARLLTRLTTPARPLTWPATIAECKNL